MFHCHLILHYTLHIFSQILSEGWHNVAARTLTRYMRVHGLGDIVNSTMENALSLRMLRARHWSLFWAASRSCAAFLGRCHRTLMDRIVTFFDDEWNTSVPTACIPTTLYFINSSFRHDSMFYMHTALVRPTRHRVLIRLPFKGHWCVTSGQNSFQSSILDVDHLMYIMHENQNKQ